MRVKQAMLNQALGTEVRCAIIPLMATALRLEGLTKTFGKHRGVSELNLAVEEGSVVGFLGPNGAGKSTTINLLMGYTKPSSGHATIFGKDAWRESVAIHGATGFLANDLALDGNLTGLQLLAYYGKMRGNYPATYVQELAKRLDCNLERKIKTLSRGNKQKVALIAALMHKPKLLLLDEPTSGLDPLVQAEFNQIILEHKAAGRTAFISSHVLSEVQELCDRMVFIRQGKIIADTTFAELTEAAPKQVKITTNDQKLTTHLKTLRGVSDFSAKNQLVSFAYTGKPQPLLNCLHGKNVDDITIQDANLENLFMEYYETEAGEAHA